MARPIEPSARALSLLRLAVRSRSSWITAEVALTAEMRLGIHEVLRQARVRIPRLLLGAYLGE